LEQQAVQASEEYLLEQLLTLVSRQLAVRLVELVYMPQAARVDLDQPTVRILWVVPWVTDLGQPQLATDTMVVYSMAGLELAAVSKLLVAEQAQVDSSLVVLQMAQAQLEPVSARGRVLLEYQATQALDTASKVLLWILGKAQTFMAV
jgi:hypothetical protein